MLSLCFVLLGQAPLVDSSPEAPPAEASQEAPAAASEQPAAAVAAADEDLFALEAEMVTAASRTSEPVRKAPASVTVVTERELRAFGYQSVADALLGVRGLYQTNDRFYASLGVRGFNRFGDYGNRLQVQMDGHVMNDDWIFSSYIDNDQFSDIQHVQSLEVVRGPGSALYGTGAFFGVVNVVTPRAAPAYRVRAGAGIVDTETLRLHVDGGHQFVNADGTQGPGFWLSTSASTLPPRDYEDPAYVGTPWAPDGVARGADAFTTGTAVGKAWWGDFTLAFSAHQRNRRVPTGMFGTVFGDVRTQADDRRAFAELRYEPKLDATSTLLLRTYLDHQAYQAFYPDLNPALSSSSEDFWSAWGGAEVRLQSEPLGPGFKTTVGAQAELHPTNRWIGRDRRDADPYIDQSALFTYLSTYALADWTPLPQLLVTGGARFDGWIIGSAATEGVAAKDPTTGFLWSLNPRLAAIFTPTEDDTVKLMLGRAYRVPSIYELTYSATGLDFANGSPVESEAIYTGELEYRRRLPLDVLAVGSVFTNYVTDLVNYRTTDDGANVDGYDNVAQPLITVGAEAELRAELPGDVLAAAQYSFQITRTEVPFTGDAIPNAPTHLGAAWLIVPLLGRDLQLASRAVVDGGRLDRDFEPVAPWVLWDVMLTSAPLDPPVTFTVGIKNLLDAPVEHPVSYRLRSSTLLQDGRTLRAEVQAHF